MKRWWNELLDGKLEELQKWRAEMETYFSIFPKGSFGFARGQLALSVQDVKIALCKAMRFNSNLVSS